MTGDNLPEPIHFILLGHSKEHVSAVIDHFEVKKIVIFTSLNLEQDNLQFINDIKGDGINVLEVIYLDPFTINALESMSHRILETYEKYSHESDQVIFSALTGGTNLMVVSMAMVAFIKGMPAHYVLNNEKNEVLEISFFQELSKKCSLAAIERQLYPGD